MFAWPNLLDAINGTDMTLLRGDQWWHLDGIIALLWHKVRSSTENFLHLFLLGGFLQAGGKGEDVEQRGSDECVKKVFNKTLLFH